MDWNWFFGALAQSFAAIVGLVGAFVFTRLVHAESAHIRDVSQIHSVLHEAQAIEDRAAQREFAWYNYQILRESIDRLNRVWNEKGLQGGSHHYMDHLDISEWDTEERARNQLEKSIQEYEPRTGMDAIWNDLTTIADQQHQANLRQEAERLKRITLEAVGIARSARRLVSIAEKNPHSSSLVSSTLLLLEFLFLFGVIYPLSFLPHPPGALTSISLAAFLPILVSVRGVLLLVGALVFSGLVVALYVKNRSLTHDPEVIAKLRERSDPATYSQYIENWIRNEASSGAE